MPTAVVATVRAIAQAHSAFSRAAFGAVLLADSGIESQSGNRPNNETEQSDCRNELGHRCLPSRMLRHPPWLPLCVFLPQNGPTLKFNWNPVVFRGQNLNWRQGSRNLGASPKAQAANRVRPNVCKPTAYSDRGSSGRDRPKSGRPSRFGRAGTDRYPPPACGNG